MPGETAFEEVDEDEAQALQVVPAALFDADVGVDACVPCSPGEALAIFVRDVLPRLRVSVPLREAEVHDVDIVLPPAAPNQEVVWFDITM